MRGNPTGLKKMIGHTRKMEWLKGQKEGNWSAKRVKWKGHDRKIRKKRRRTEKEKSEEHQKDRKTKIWLTETFCFFSWQDIKIKGTWNEHERKWKVHERSIDTRKWKNIWNHRLGTWKENTRTMKGTESNHPLADVTVATLSTSLYIGMVQYSWHICTLSGSTLHRHCGYLWLSIPTFLKHFT